MKDMPKVQFEYFNIKIFFILSRNSKSTVRKYSVQQLFDRKEGRFNSQARYRNLPLLSQQCSALQWQSISHLVRYVRHAQLDAESTKQPGFPVHGHPHRNQRRRHPLHFFIPSHFSDVPGLTHTDFLYFRDGLRHYRRLRPAL